MPGSRVHPVPCPGACCLVPGLRCLAPSPSDFRRKSKDIIELREGGSVRLTCGGPSNLQGGGKGPLASCLRRGVSMTKSGALTTSKPYSQQTAKTVYFHRASEDIKGNAFIPNNSHQSTPKKAVCKGVANYSEVESKIDETGCILKLYVCGTSAIPEVSPGYIRYPTGTLKGTRGPQGLCAHYAPTISINRFAVGPMGPKCAHDAPTKLPLCAHYAPTMSRNRFGVEPMGP